MSFIDTHLKMIRKNPDWVYFLDIESIKVETRRWWGMVTVETHYHVDVDGRSLIDPDKTNDHMKFKKVFNHMPERHELNELIDEYHKRVRQSSDEIDWAEKERLEREKAKKELEEKLRQELEEKIKKELAEAEEKMKEEQEKKKITIG